VKIVKHPAIPRDFGQNARIFVGRFFSEECPLPLYEYRCTACGYSFEKIQKYSDEPESECPKCHGALVRPVTAPALRFEGAGWYVNDYAGKGAAKPAEGVSADAKPADSAAPAESKSETKPDSAETKAAPPPAAPVAAATPAASSTSGS